MWRISRALFVVNFAMFSILISNYFYFVCDQYTLPFPHSLANQVYPSLPLSIYSSHCPFCAN